MIVVLLLLPLLVNEVLTGPFSVMRPGGGWDRCVCVEGVGARALLPPPTRVRIVAFFVGSEHC